MMKRNNAKTISLKEQWTNFFKLLRSAKVPWYLYILTFLSDATEATLFVRLPILLGDLMNGDIFDQGKITQYGLLSLGDLVFGFASVCFFCWVSTKVGISTSAGIWKKVLHLPSSRIDQEGPSTLTSRVVNDSSSIDAAISGIFNSLGMIYSLVLIYIEIFKMHSGMATMLLLVPVWLIISMSIVGRLTYRAQRRITDARAVLTSYLAIRIPNIRLIKAFATQKQEQAACSRRIGDQYGAEMKQVQIDALASVFQEIAGAVTNIIVIAYGSYLIGSGQMEVGNFIPIFLFVSQGKFLFNAQVLMMYYQNIKIGMGGCSKISELMEAEEEQLTREKSFTVPEADIVFDHVTFGYGEEQVLRDVSMTIPKGKVTAIVGPNGSGKTTVLKLLERLYTPTSGKITYGGTDIENYHLADWRASIGYVVQNSPLLIGTVTDNICYGMAVPDCAAAEAAARQVGADDFIREMEQGYDTSVGELGSKLSGGQRQKLAIARALAKKPDMYLLDEATCGLDACNEREITEFMNDFLRGRTAVIVAHNLDTIRMADQIIVLKDGQVEAAGDHSSLLERSELYRKFCSVTA